MGRKSLEAIAKEFGKSYADEQFREFQEHPEYQGTHFNWVGFAETCGRFARTQMWLNGMNGFSKLPKARQEQAMDWAETAAIEAWKCLLIKG